MKAYIEPIIKIYEFDCDIKAGGLIDASSKDMNNDGSGSGIIVAPPVDETSVHQ